MARTTETLPIFFKRRTLYKYGPLSLGALVCLAFFGIGWYSRDWLPPSTSIRGVAIREATSNYKYINPLLLCDNSPVQDYSGFKTLKNKIQVLINKSIENGDTARASVYYRENGEWMSINENDKYSPASLLKIPTMIAFFKLAEDHPDLLSKKVTYYGRFDDNKAEEIKPAEVLKVGQTYTIDELIYRMIAFSDNNAARLLNENIDQAALSEVYKDLGLNVPTLGGPVDFMSAKEYSYFFRVLYNASYLTRDLSEKALDYLSKPDFPMGIAAGVPNTLTVAQKFGERSVYATAQSQSPYIRELHDCGVVYYPKHPYLVCIMTSGEDYLKLEGVIQGISKLVYQEVESKYSGK